MLRESPPPLLVPRVLGSRTESTPGPRAGRPHDGPSTCSVPWGWSPRRTADLSVSRASELELADAIAGHFNVLSADIPVGHKADQVWRGTLWATENADVAHSGCNLCGLAPPE